MSFGDRAKKAIKLRGWSIRTFQQELKRLGVVGSSYPQVHRYLGNKRPPSIQFMDAAANLLNVRAEWLRTGEDPMAPTPRKRARINELLWLEGAQLEAAWKCADEIMMIRELAAENRAEEWLAFIERLAHVPRVVLYPADAGPSEDAWADFLLAFVVAITVLVRDRQRSGWSGKAPEATLHVVNQNLVDVSQEIEWPNKIEIGSGVQSNPSQA